MEALIKYILQFGNLNQQQIDLITSKATEQEIKKDDYFSEAGKIARRVGFVLDGIVRVCYYNNKGEEITKYFIEENNLVVDLESFNNEIASTAYVQAVTDCRLIVFSKKDWQELLNTIVGWDAVVHLRFLEIYPTVVNRIPLSFIASYLGVTQSSLSRIRKNIR
jgi:CRP-like cAMP-binding protein